MRFKKNFLFNYLKNAPFALALERSMECEIMARQEFVRPILDIGCGDGLFAFMLFDEKIDVGIEPNARELRRAKEYGMYEELIRCYGNNISKDSESFNTIFCNSVLEHIPEVRSVIDEAHRLLSPGGRFYVTIPTDMFDNYSISYQLLSLSRLYDAAEQYRRIFNKFWKHFHYYKQKEWEKVFEDSGFQVIDFKEYDSKITCLIHHFFVPFAFPSLITKKITNRWIVSKGLRRIYIFPFYLVARGVIKRFERGKNGGIIFLSLKKK
jgi:2-polyprenyl-3-methyl-5-hydroxy-6-metoxy-1,4-benzoquinol methylase